MSAAHVDAINRILVDDAASRAECAKLARPYWFVHQLEDAGSTVWWTVEFSPHTGVRFSLGPPPVGVTADVTLRGSYAAVIEAMHLGRAGTPVPYPCQPEGDLAAMALFNPALEAARGKATLETDLPVVKR